MGRGCGYITTWLEKQLQLIFHDFVSYKPPFSLGIFQLAMFDDTREYVFNSWCPRFNHLACYKVVALQDVLIGL